MNKKCLLFLLSSSILSGMGKGESSKEVRFSSEEMAKIISLQEALISTSPKVSINPSY